MMCEGDITIIVKNRGLDNEVELQCCCEASILLSNQGSVGPSTLYGALRRPSLSMKGYEAYIKYIYSRMDGCYADTIKKVHEAVRRHYASKGSTTDGLLDIDITFDGTWMTRGHGSHIGIGLVLEVDIRLVVDFEVLCNNCIPCKARKKVSPATFSAWKERHQCHKNFDGKSAMKAEAAVRMWQR